MSITDGAFNEDGWQTRPFTDEEESGLKGECAEFWLDPLTQAMSAVASVILEDPIKAESFLDPNASPPPIE